MSNVDLTQQFEEDSPQQVNEIDNVQSLSNYVLQLQSLEDAVKVLEENLGHLSLETLRKLVNTNVRKIYPIG